MGNIRTSQSDTYPRRLGLQGRVPCVAVSTAVLLAAVAAMAPGPVAAAADILVPPGDVAALVSAIHTANASGERTRIVLAPGTYALGAVNNNSPSGATVLCQGSNGLPVVTGKVTLVGNPDRSARIERVGSAPPLRLFEVSASGELDLEGLTLAGGNLTDPQRPYGAAVCNQGGSVNLRRSLVESNAGVYGGVIANVTRKSRMGVFDSTVRGNQGGGHAVLSAGHLVVNNARILANTGGGVSTSGELLLVHSTLDGNNADGGGGLYNDGSASIDSSTLSSNTAGHGDGGAIHNMGNLVVQNSTISGNLTAPDQQAGGVMNTGVLDLLNVTLTGNDKLNLYSAGTVRLQNSIVSNCGLVNPAISLGHNLASDVSCNLSGPGDLVGVDPRLGPLADNGGPTLTRATLPGSPAATRFRAGGCPAADQRGALRLWVNGCEIGAYTSGAPKELLTHASRSTIGDKDDLQAGGIVDRAAQSLAVRNLVRFIAADPGQGPGVDYDSAGENRPVGATHFVALPPGARITTARLQFRARVGQLGYNDGVYFAQTTAPGMSNPACYQEADPGCVSRGALLPVIALRDLIGREPQTNETLQYEIDLGRAPLRTVDTTLGAGGHWSNKPEEYRNLIPLLLPHGQWDMVFSDDMSVDWSDLTVTFILPGAPVGDLNGDALVDGRDLQILMNVLNTNAYGPDDPRDLDGDGRITVLDVRKLVLRCTRAGCA